MTDDINITPHSHLFDLPKKFEDYQSLSIFLAAGLTLEDFTQSVLAPLVPILRRDRDARPIRHDHLLGLCEYISQLAAITDLPADWAEIAREITQLRTFVCEHYRKINPSPNLALIIIWLQEPMTLGLDFVKVGGDND